jgi:Protein of unknown function (DUF664)
METRYGAPVAGPEKEVLTGYMDHYRRTLLDIIQGVSDEDLRRPLTPSGLTLLGLTKHLALVERWWFGEHVADDPEFSKWDPDDPDADFRVEPDETTQQIIDLYASSCERSREILSTASLDDKIKKAVARHRYNVRWVLMNMIVETARHCGHADILRERIDGSTGAGYDV